MNKPYTFVTSAIWNFSRKSIIIFLGTDAPAAIPIRKQERSISGRRSSISDANIAGTPCSAVHRSFVMAIRTADGWNVSLGNTMLLPWVNAASSPSTSPKQWNRGGGQQITSSDVSRILSPTKRALLTRFLWVVSIDYALCIGHTSYLDVSMAAFGTAVVPLVYWKLQTSSAVTERILWSRTECSMSLPDLTKSSYLRNWYEVSVPKIITSCNPFNRFIIDWSLSICRVALLDCFPNAGDVKSNLLPMTAVSVRQAQHWIARTWML